MSEMFSPEVASEIHRLFTQEPKGGMPLHAGELRRSVDPIEEFCLQREWATHRLAKVAMEDSALAIEALDGIYQEKPFNAFGLGINIVRILQANAQLQPAEHIQARLAQMLDDDTYWPESRRQFTVFDRLWLEGKDLDRLNDDFVAYYLLSGDMEVAQSQALSNGSSTEWQNTKKGEKGALFGTVATSEKEPLDLHRLQSFSQQPRNPTNNLNYDSELLRLALRFEEHMGYPGVVRLTNLFPARSKEIAYKVNLVIDRSMHAYAENLHQADQRNDTRLAPTFVQTTKPLTDLGRQLLEEFKKRIGA